MKYIIYRLNEDRTTIIKEKTSEDDGVAIGSDEAEAYEKFLAALPETDCRYAIYDFEYETEGEGKRYGYPQAQDGSLTARHTRVQ